MAVRERERHLAVTLSILLAALLYLASPAAASLG
jgi:hypothetical protein